MVVEYGFKVFAFRDGAKSELRGISELSICSEEGELQATASLKIAASSLSAPIDEILISCSHFKDCLFEVSEVLSIDANFKKLVAKTPLRLPQNISSLKDLASLTDKVSFLCDAPQDTSLTGLSYSDASSLAGALEGIGLSFWANDLGIFISDKFYIAKPAVSAAEFNEDNIIDFNLSLSAPQNIDTIIFNDKNEDIYSEAGLTAVIDPDPHPVTPREVLRYKDDENGDVYVISPLRAVGKIFATPAWEAKDISLNAPNASFFADYRAVEEFELSEDICVKLTGFIKKLIAVSLDGTPLQFSEQTAQEQHGNIYKDNVLCFEGPLSGTLKVAYESNIYLFVCPARDLPSALSIKAEYKNLQIDHLHKYEITKFYPKGYTHTFSLMRDFDVDSALIAHAGFKLGTQSFSADPFGEVEIKFSDYGAYKLELYLDGKLEKTMNIGYFANEFSCDFNEIKEKD